MSEWAARLLFPPEKPRADLDEFVQEVNNENVEYLSFKKDFDERKEIKPSFEQVGQDRILEEANKNIKILKSLETVIYERSQSYSALLAAQSKYKGAFETFQYSEGTIRQSLDALFVFLEQDLQQARQRQLFGDMKKVLQQVRSDTQKRLADYQREVHTAEKDVSAAEKKLSKSREVMDKSLDARLKLNVSDQEKDAAVAMTPRLQIPLPRAMTMTSSMREGTRLERIRECDEAVARCDRDIKEDIRGLLRALTTRDQVLVASRRAHQKLDRQCKNAMHDALKKFVEREREAAIAREAVLDKLENAVANIDLEADLDDFIGHYRPSDDEGLQLCSQALTILGDLMTPDADFTRATTGAGNAVGTSVSTGGAGIQSNVSYMNTLGKGGSLTPFHSRFLQNTRSATASPIQLSTINKSSSSSHWTTTGDTAEDSPETAVGEETSSQIGSPVVGVDGVDGSLRSVSTETESIKNNEEDSIFRISSPTTIDSESEYANAHDKGAGGSLGVSAPLAAAASATATTLGYAVTSGVPIAEALASIVNMVVKEQGRRVDAATSAGITGAGGGGTGGASGGDVDDMDVSAEEINYHLNRIFYGTPTPFSPMFVAGGSNRDRDRDRDAGTLSRCGSASSDSHPYDTTQTPGTAPSRSMEMLTNSKNSLVNSNSNAPDVCDDDVIEVTPVRVIGPGEDDKGTKTVRKGDVYTPVATQHDRDKEQGEVTGDYEYQSTPRATLSTSFESFQIEGYWDNPPKSSIKHVAVPPFERNISETHVMSTDTHRGGGGGGDSSGSIIVTDYIMGDSIDSIEKRPEPASTSSSSKFGEITPQVGENQPGGDGVEEGDASQQKHSQSQPPIDPQLESHQQKMKNMEASVAWLSDVTKTQRGRNAFITVLNQFRSKKVEMGEGFTALGAVLWDVLDRCRESNDVHTAKVIMMLSQTFYRRRRLSSMQLFTDEVDTAGTTASSSSSSSSSAISRSIRQPQKSVIPTEGISSSGAGLGSREASRHSIDPDQYNERETDISEQYDENDRIPDRSAQNRDYLKEMLMAHAIWRDASFWEQALWQCAIEQLHTIPYERAWYDMNPEDRAEAVRRVHNVIFSQVMAITHSMIELGCSKAQTREFIYRMCVVHQLSERQRQQLLSHLLSR